MDKHLNCFYSYNRDNELIENNITRALIITLMNVSKGTKNYILSTLLSKADSGSRVYSFTDACFALQNNIRSDNIKEIKDNYILTIADDTFIQNENEYFSIKNIVKETLESGEPPPGSEPMLLELCSGSIPDAWIYDKISNYSFLVECKIRGDCLYYAQIIRHANKNYGITDLDVLKNKTISRTWNDILEVIDQLQKADDHLCNIDQFLIRNFLEFLSYCGYFLFKGIEMEKVPFLNLDTVISTSETFKLFDFASLGAPVNLFTLE